jgi:hypothetical protein
MIRKESYQSAKDQISSNYRYVSPGTIDADQSSVSGGGLKSKVSACGLVKAFAIARDRWSNVQTTRLGKFYALVVGGGFTGGSSPGFQESIMVPLELSVLNLLEVS